MNGKCDLCALKVVFDQDITRTDPRNTEVFFAALRDLQKRNIVGTGYSKSLSVSNTGLGDKSEVCAVNSPQFGPSHKERVCPHFILNMGLSV